MVGDLITVIYLSVLLFTFLLSLWGIIHMFANIIAQIKKWKYNRKRDEQIIKLAKAHGIWDKPQYLYGRALELRAQKDFKIKREPRESDAHLRYRCSILEKRIETIKKKAKERGINIEKVEADENNINIIICDENPSKKEGKK